jgi:hypothetical protein
MWCSKCHILNCPWSGAFALINHRDLAEAIGIACKKEDKSWGGHNTSFATIIDNVVGYEDDVRARLD